MADDIEFEVYEALCGVRGELATGCCDAQSGTYECTRAVGHVGDHVAAHPDGRVLARWREGDIPVNTDE